MEVLHLNQESFDKLTQQSGKPVLIDFWATWCGPCQKLGPELEALAAECDDIIIGKVDVDSYPQIAVALGVNTIPALFFYRNGKIEKNLVGYMNKDELKKRLGI
jgi:thioredoxin 1